MIGNRSVRCPNCERKSKKGYEFCPYCGSSLDSFFNREKHKDDFGFLGTSDKIENHMIMGSGFNSLFGNLINELNRQMSSLDKELKEESKDKNKKRRQVSGFSISISSNGQSPVKITSFGNNMGGNLNIIPNNNLPKIRKINLPKISEDKIKKSKDFIRVEAESEVRRLGDIIIYELDIKGVDDLNNVNINIVSNIVEIRAIGEKKIYTKDIKIDRPIKSFHLDKGKLILEFYL